MAERNLTPAPQAAESPQRPTAADVRVGLAPGQMEAQLRHVDGTPLSRWLTSAEAFDVAVQAALARYPREQIQIWFEQSLE